MVQIRQGSIFDSDCEAICNPVNCMGVSGAGLALAFKARFPDGYLAYQAHCLEGKMTQGTVFTFERKRKPKYIIHIPTKYQWFDRSSIMLIRNSLVATAVEVRRLEIKSIAIPALGCGCGQLEWQDVKPLIVEVMTQLDELKVEIYEPMQGASLADSEGDENV